MKHLAMVVLLVLCGAAAAQTPTYYVSSSAGSDTNGCLSEGTPFATITKASEAVLKGMGR